MLINFRNQGYYKLWFMKNYRQLPFYVNNPYNMKWKELIQLKIFRNSIYIFISGLIFEYKFNLRKKYHRNPGQSSIDVNDIIKLLDL